MHLVLIRPLDLHFTKSLKILSFEPKSPTLKFKTLFYKLTPFGIKNVKLINISLFSEIGSNFFVGKNPLLKYSVYGFEIGGGLDKPRYSQTMWLSNVKNSAKNDMTPLSL